jgi:hypothetical protein
VVNGACFARTTDIALTLFSDPVSLGLATTDANGGFSVTVTIPSNTPVGTHTLTAAGGGQSASLSLLVSDTGLVVSGSGLSWNLGILGLAMLAAGIILLAGDRISKQDLIEFA